MNNPIDPLGIETMIGMSHIHHTGSHTADESPLVPEVITLTVLVHYCTDLYQPCHRSLYLI